MRFLFDSFLRYNPSLLVNLFCGYYGILYMDSCQLVDKDPIINFNIDLYMEEDKPISTLTGVYHHHETVSDSFFHIFINPLRSEYKIFDELKDTVPEKFAHFRRENSEFLKRELYKLNCRMTLLEVRDIDMKFELNYQGEIRDCCLIENERRRKIDNHSDGNDNNESDSGRTSKALNNYQAKFFFDDVMV